MTLTLIKVQVQIMSHARICQILVRKLIGYKKELKV